MKSWQEWLNKRREFLRKVKKMAENDLDKMPEGKLRVSTSKKQVRFYQIVVRNGQGGMYLPSENQESIKQLAQKDYILDLIKAATAEIRKINSMMKCYPTKTVEDVYARLHKARKPLVTPYAVDDKTYAELWLAKTYAENPYLPEERKFATKRGELVRSKSEAMIADAYYDLGIPYKYDYPVDVGNGRVKYVDFALLDVARRTIIYHEHLGMLDHPEYLAKNMQKLQDYQKVGIFVGKNLLLTHEIDGFPLNMNYFRKNIAELFGKA
ncbi:MAG: hypothetical protein J6Y08_04090 [Clostridiales bacterium]|nr:hypothetical protein [Clostridiales bacterium]